ncbi:MAG: FKBP-type peptidyl-prolyl cis-trans isomerase [Bacteroidia bacterium]|nr:FKBP-type peptidyl-prolyl cis-trans isomerase [Bacteroidia bacterium]
MLLQSHFRKFIFYFGLLLSGIIFFSCGTDEVFDSYTKKQNGIYFKLVAFNEGNKKITEGDYVFLKAIYKTQNDSVFWDSRYNAGKNYFFKISAKKLSSPFFGFLLNEYTNGDSLAFKINKKIFFRDVFDTIAPWFTQKDSIVNAEIMIEKVLSEADFMKFIESGDLRIESDQWQQKKSIEEWVLSNFQNAEKADSLLYFERYTTTADSMVKPGKTVTLTYKGMYLSGQVFDEVKEAKPLTINYGYEGQMLRGIEKVMRRLRKGENAKIIIPSHLGFGEYGSSNGTVPPNTPVVYEVKIIDVK